MTDRHRDREKSFEAVFADRKGRVFSFKGLRAAGMKAGEICSVRPDDWIRLPAGSELFALPDRLPAGLDPVSGRVLTLRNDPYRKSPEPVCAVAAFAPPGYTLSYNAAYYEGPHARLLPLFAYGACAYSKGRFYVSAFRVDIDTRHEERLLSASAVRKGIRRAKRIFPNNRLIRHLADCATVNACANAKNFFLGRAEAPVPVSPTCNAQCRGCISFQPCGGVPPTQNRIAFTPAPEEIAEIALYHLGQATDPIVSFGQGCEGEPSLASGTVREALKRIRRQTAQGTLHMNTNGSRPAAIASFFEAGLDSIRVSLNSVRKPYYTRYYRPRGYTFSAVCETIRVAKSAGGFVSLNYLCMPGFTDSETEFRALRHFIRKHRVDMIQWRNLNYDPMRYCRDLGLRVEPSQMLGMREGVRRLKKDFPALLDGYFNPARQKMVT